MCGSMGYQYTLLKMQEIAIAPIQNLVGSRLIGEARREDLLQSWVRHFAHSIDANIKDGIKIEDLMPSA